MAEDLTELAACLQKALSQKDDPLRTRLQNAERHAWSLQDVNSAFPETRKFLEARGLSSVRQLDASGKAELIAHLHAVFQTVGS